MFELMGQNIFAYRKKNGLTQEQLAEKLGVSAVAVSKWERGISVPELGVVCQLADCFQVSVDELLGRDNCLLPEEEKYSDASMKQFDLEMRKSIIDRYALKTCTVDLLEEMSEIDDKTIQLILRKLNNTTLLYALVGASGKVCKRFMKNLSGRMLEFFDRQMQIEKFEDVKIRTAQNAVLKIWSMTRE